MVEVIKGFYPSLKGASKKIADAFLEYPEDIFNYNIYDFADKVGVSTSSISRFCKKVFDMSFVEVKIVFAQQSKLNVSNEIISWTSDMSRFPDILINQLTNYLTQVKLLNNKVKIDNCIKLLAKAEHIFVYGVGNSSIIAQDFTEKMLKIRKKCIYYTDSSMKGSTAFIVTKKDVVVSISNSGMSKEVILTTEQAKKNGAKIISITSNCKNQLRKLANIEILTPDVETKNRIAAIFSRYCGLFVADMLFIGVAQIILDNPQETTESFNELIYSINRI